MEDCPLFVWVVCLCILDSFGGFWLFLDFFPPVPADPPPCRSTFNYTAHHPQHTFFLHQSDQIESSIQACTSMDLNDNYLSFLKASDTLLHLYFSSVWGKQASQELSNLLVLEPPETVRLPFIRVSIFKFNAGGKYSVKTNCKVIGYSNLQMSPVVFVGDAWMKWLSKVRAKSESKPAVGSGEDPVNADDLAGKSSWLSEDQVLDFNS